MSADSTKRADVGEIDLSKHRPVARRDKTAVREQDEANAFVKPDGRHRRRKSRTALISFRIHPRVHEKMQRIATAEGCSYVEVVERGIELLDKMMKGEKP
jgi:hypothetical protein